MIRALWVDKPKRLFHKSKLLEVPIKEGIGNIKLSNELVGENGNIVKEMNNSDFNHRAKSLDEVHPMLLTETFGKNVGFVPLNKPVGMLFGFKDPFTIDYIYVHLS